MRAIPRFWSAAGQAAAAEAAWHLAGPAWAFGLAVLFLAWHLPAAIMPASATALEKARAVEKRLNAVVGQIPAPQTRPGDASNTSYGASDGSSGMGGGTQVSYSQEVGNNGGANSQTSGVGAPAYTGGADNGGHTSGQIGGASAHYHDMSHAHGLDHAHSMTHYHTSSSDLQNVFNGLRNSHSALVTATNTLRASHTAVINSHNNLLDVLGTSGLLR